MFIRWNSASGKLGSILDDDHVAGGKAALMFRSSSRTRVRPRKSKFAI
jgi:hypothetical protein